MNEFTIELSDKSGKHLYEQIYEYIKREIVEGRMKRSDKLPSTRSLSSYLQVSRSTVSLAYDQLLAEGYIESRQGSGFFVSKIDELYQGKMAKTPQILLEKKKDNSCSYVFSPTDIDLNEFPYATWKKLTREVLIEYGNELFVHGNAQGEESLRESIRDYLHASRGVNCLTEQIVIGAGNDYLLMLLQLIFSKDNIFAFENPTYVKAYKTFLTMGYPVKTVEMDRNGIQIGALNQCGASIAYVMPSHQYPTGIVMPIGRRIELLKWASKEDNRFLIEDDYDSEFRYKGKPIPSLQSIDTLGKVIYLGTFSKAIAPAIRISYMVLPMGLLNIYKEEGTFLSSTVPRMDQRILSSFIQNGSFERYLNRMRKVYREKHDILVNALKPFQDMFDIEGENAGLHLLLRDKGKTLEKSLIDSAKEYGVRVYGMSEYQIDNVNDRTATIILGYAGLSKKEIKDGVEQLKKAWL